MAALTEKTKSLLKKEAGKILIVDDDKDVLSAARLLLKSHYDTVLTSEDPAELPSLLKNHELDLIILDMNFSRFNHTGEEGFGWLKRIHAWDPAISIILVTAYGDVEMAVRGMKEGATDFLIKPWLNEKMLATVSMAMQLRQSKTEVAELKSQQKQLWQDMNQAFGEIIGQSPAMQEVFDTIRKIADTDANVLLLGENGTGKEVIARTIHNLSLRADQNFVGIDMGSISESLFESELFGHVKGAFTDARESRPGRFEMANNGTLFLDEIGNLPMTLQSKLLSALQSRKVVRVGSNKEIPIDIRLICATNQPIHQMVAEHKFRQDLVFRINTIEIHLPPLREREGDIRILAEHYLGIYAKKYKRPDKKFSEAALERLESYSWPGNVRELQHAVERAVIMSGSDTLQPQDFFFSNTQAHKTKGEMELESFNLEVAEKKIILKVIDRHKGNISRAAKELGLTRAALYRRIEKYGL